MQDFTRRTLAATVAIAALAGLGAAAQAETKEVRFGRQLGVGYLQLYVMEELKLVEKHAQAAGLEIMSPTGPQREVRQVQARFTAAMAPLGRADSAAPFSVECDHPGKGYWADERTWVYDLPAGLRGGDLHIPPGGNGGADFDLACAGQLEIVHAGCRRGHRRPGAPPGALELHAVFGNTARYPGDSFPAGPSGNGNHDARGLWPGDHRSPGRGGAGSGD